MISRPDVIIKFPFETFKVSQQMWRIMCRNTYGLYDLIRILYYTYTI